MWPIYLLEAPSQYELAATFLRFQEYYESPKFKGQIFDLEEFIDWYAKKDGKFNYFSYWEGFNFPSRVLTPFKEGKFDPLLRKEKRLLERLKDASDPFYVIGVRAHSTILLRHEVLHGIYHFSPIYQRMVSERIKASWRDEFKPVLNKMGYVDEVIDDEINAYSIAGFKDLTDEGLDVQTARRAQKALRKLFRQHFKFSLEDKTPKEIRDFIHVVPW